MGFHPLKHVPLKVDLGVIRLSYDIQTISKIDTVELLKLYKLDALRSDFKSIG